MIQIIERLKAQRHLYGVMERNVVNSTIKLGFHMYASLEVLQTFYGWDTPFTEPERVNLVADTLKTLEAEHLQLNFYKDNKSKFYEIRKQFEAGDIREFIQGAINPGDGSGSERDDDKGDSSEGPRGGGDDGDSDGLHKHEGRSGTSDSDTETQSPIQEPGGQEAPTEGDQENVRGAHEGGKPNANVNANW